MMNQDRIIIETYERKNELESMCYQWKDKLAKSHQDFCKAEDIPAIMQLLEQTSNWLYDEGQNANRGTYVDRINAVKEKIDPIQKRYENLERLSEEMNNFAGCLKHNFDYVNSLDQKYAHISPEDRQEVINLIERMRVWAANA